MHAAFRGGIVPERCRPRTAAALGLARKSNGRGQRPAPVLPRRCQRSSSSMRWTTTAINIRAGDRVLLIVENDIGFARFLLDVAREHGMKGLVTSLGAAALALAREYKPHAVTLDIFLPDIEGWRVLERLKRDLATRHMPVCVISTEEARRRALASGAIAFLAKPIQSRDVLDGMFDYLSDFISRPKRHVVVVEPDATRRRANHRSGVAPTTSRSLRQKMARRHWRCSSERRPDCVVVNPSETVLPKQLAASKPSWNMALSQLPVIVYGSEQEGDGAWNRLADTCTLRRVESPERLLDLMMLFTHRTVSQLPSDKRQMLDRFARLGSDSGRQKGADRR